MEKINYRWIILISLPWLVIGLVIAVWNFSLSGRRGLVTQMNPQESTLLESATVQPKLAVDVPITILFGGDLMFDRYIRQIALKRGNDFVFASDLRERMHSADVVVANLEGPITSNASRSAGSIIGSRENYIFTFDPSWTQTLKANNITTVNIGNNHILNFGETGLVETQHYLDAAGVRYFGLPHVPMSRDLQGDPRDEQHRTVILEMRGVKIGFVNENQFVAEGEMKALVDARALRSQVDILVAYTHWGTEYLPATDDERRRAHALIDAGVDVVIGSHPHIVQEKEVYKNKTIYYSLGNFVFDQYEQEATQRGLLVEMRIDPQTKNLQFEDIPVTLQPNGQTKI